jgi:DNA invertase Pin-like site-specific DNA recombinase
LQLLNSRIIELTIGRSLSQSWFGALTVSPDPLKYLLLALEEFRSLGVQFISYQENIYTSSPLGQALFTIVGAVAQLERDLIRERVSAGIRNARANGKKLGRPRVKANLEEILQLKAEGHSLRKIAAKLGIGDGTVRDRLKDQRGKPHAKGPS